MSRVDERVANGLCPQCGEEAAPFYLCFRCRMIGRTRRTMKRLASQGVVTQSKDERGRQQWEINPHAKDDPRDNRWSTPVVPNESDRRFRPRLGGIPVNVEAKIIELLQSIGRPCEIEEIVRAWANLRGEKKRKKGSAAADVRAIILAEDRRRKRAEKRMSHV